MSDVNTALGEIENSISGTPLSMDEIHSGWALGVMFGLDFSDRFSAGVGYDRLYASSEAGDATGSLKYDLPANAFRAFSQYSFSGVRKSGAYLGGSVGLISEVGYVTSAAPGVGSKDRIAGSGGLFEVFVGGDWWATPQFALYGSGGYRYAKISEAEVNGNVIYLPGNQKVSIDYSGFLARAGLKFAFTK